jgi:small-conductance mechanosensitive channel
MSVQRDSLQIANDSIIEALRTQVHELKLQGIMMREQLEITGKDAYEDSVHAARLRQRIDSLRQLTSGVPLVVDNDTLLKLYARKGGMLPSVRAEQAAEKILEAGKRMTMFLDSVYIYNSELQSDIMMGEEVLLSVTDMDALWNNTDREILAQQYKSIIESKIKELYDEYGMQQKLKGIGLVVLIITVQAFLIWFTLFFVRRLKHHLIRRLMRTLGPWQVKDYTVMNVHQVGMLVATVFNVLLILLIIIQLMVSVPLMFSMFPETKELTYTFIGYILNPIRHILGDVVSYIPNLFQIIIIVICFRYVIKGIRYFASEIANGNLKVNGFYADWAMPTFTILRILLYSFMLVMIWPLLPNSDSEVFQGVSVFIGIIVSLGSTSIVGNIMAGLVMTYMRPFHVGDYIRFGETMGEVVEKNILVTRVRTLKNELITIPNSTLMGSQISNFSFSAQKYGIIVHTKITIGYDQRWQSIRDLLLEAADKTEGLKKHPKPFVNVTALDDSYVEYEINAYTERHKSIPAIYTALHANILDTMHKAGVEIMSPTIFATRPNIPLQIPEED